MNIQFTVNDVTFNDEDKAYFEKRFNGLVKFLSDADNAHINVKISKNKQRSGDRFEVSAELSCPKTGNFYAILTADNIKKCADLLKDSLKRQIIKTK